MDATTVAVDLAKDIFEIAVASRADGIIERKRLTRRQFERCIDALPASAEEPRPAIRAAHHAHHHARARRRVGG